MAGNNGADISFDEARAKAWINDVNQEIILVESLLSKVYYEIENVVDEDDPIMKAIEEGGKKIEEEWNGMIKEFKSAMSIVEDTLNKLVQGIQDAIEEVISHRK